MAVSDEDGTAERLSQVRAQRRHIGRLRVAERRDATHERAADSAAAREAETGLGHDPLAPPDVLGRQPLAADRRTGGARARPCRPGR